MIVLRSQQLDIGNIDDIAGHRPSYNLYCSVESARQGYEESRKAKSLMLFAHLCIYAESAHEELGE